MSEQTRVLVVDDDPLTRNLLVSALRNECSVAVAADGCEAFQTALATPPHIAVIDVNMPGWDGLRTLEAFRAHPVLRTVKIVMLTADTSQQTVKAAVDRGANDYIVKTSFSKTELYRKLNRLVPETIADRGTSNLQPTPTGMESAATWCAPTADGDAAAPRARMQSADPRMAMLTSGTTDSRLQEMIDAWE